MLLGLLPAVVVGLLDEVGSHLLGASLAHAHSGSWALVPVSPERASYRPVVFLVGIALASFFPLEHFLATPEGRAAGEAWRRRLSGQEE